MSTQHFKNKSKHFQTANLLRTCPSTVNDLFFEYFLTLTDINILFSPHLINSRPSPYPGVNQILPSLYLCSAAAARVNILEHLKISLVINLAPELIVDTPLPSNPKPIYLRIPVLDKGHVDLKQFFDETCDLMEDVRQSGGKTLVHCVAGVSRSAAICVAYLMKYEKMSLKEAFKHVKLARPQIRPNCGFFRQLMAYELELTGVQTVHWVMVESIGQEVPDVYEPEYKAMEQFYQRHRHRHVRRRD